MYRDCHYYYIDIDALKDHSYKTSWMVTLVGIHTVTIMWCIIIIDLE